MGGDKWESEKLWVFKNGVEKDENPVIDSCFIRLNLKFDWIIDWARKLFNAAS